MPPKRRRDDDQAGDSVVRPDVGTRTFVSGAAVKEGLASGSRQAIVSFHQQIHTYQSKLPLPISHPTVTILQHYLDVSPSCDEILNAWREGDRTRNDRLVESAVGLLGLIVRILKPLPFFRTTLMNLANKVLTPSEPFSDSINRSLQSERRDLIQATLSFVAAVVQLDPPSVGVNQGSGGKLAIRLWSVLSDGGSIRGMGKMFGMRIRNQDGKPLYDSHDPNDRADIRHLALQTVLPLLALPNVYSYARTLMPPIYSHMDQDPPVTIFRILSAIWDVITLSSPGTSRRISLALINESSLEHLFKLLPRADFDPISGQKVGDVVKAFIEGVTTTPGRGLCFVDDGWYPRQVEDKGSNEDEVRGNREDKEKQKLHNRILSNVIRKLGARAIDNDGKLGEIVTKVVNACPELVAGYWAHSALAVDPKLDIRWMATMAFIGRIIALPPPSRTTFRRPAPRGSDVMMPLRSEPPAVSTIIESILPSPMHKNHLTRGLQHADALVRHMTAVTLARGLQKLQVVQNLLGEIEAEMAAEPSSSQEGSWSRVRRELEFEARRRVPDVIVVITFAQQSAQLAPAEADTEEEQALLAKSTMLTESALRLFGLYYRTLPSLAGEAKFDVGRLLVSSSSAKAEKKQRNMMKSGSVADGDSGSIASFGTAGTAGMGGGFGYARGEVRGFDALSQVHVLALLRDVKEWDWARKAAASQFTYLYHILQLNLNTQLSVTRDLSTSLINNMLQPTLLFEHDPSETFIWTSALPRAHSSLSGPLLTVQQIHLLSFLDDCFRRAQQFPYRYMEQLTTLLPDYFSWSDPVRMVSCVLMAIVEQFHAKVQGQLIATDAAVVVLGYLRRVMLGLMGKMDDQKFVMTVLAKLEETCEAAKAKGQERPGLETIIHAMRHDIGLVFGGSDNSTFSETTDFPRLVDEEQWRATSLESLLLHGVDPELSVKTQDVVRTSPAAVAARQTRFLIHLLNQHPPTTPIVIDRIQDCLIRCQGSEEYPGVKAVVFGAPCVKDLLLTEQGDEYRHSLASLVSHLSADSVQDFALIEPIVARLVHLLKKPKKYSPLKTLEMLSPWRRLLDAENAATITALLPKAASKLKDLPATLHTTISNVFKAARDSSVPLAHLSTLVDLKLYRPFTEILSSPDIFEHVTSVTVDEDTLRGLLGEADDEASALVAGLVRVSPTAAKSVAAIAAAEPDRLVSASMLPIAAELLDLSQPFDLGDSEQRLLLTALEALRQDNKDLQQAARRVLSLTSDHSDLTRLVTEIDLRSFTKSHAELAVQFAQQNKAELSPSITHLVQLALQQTARACSGEGELSETALDIISHILSVIELLPELTVAVELIEPVITTVISDRLHIDMAVNLATKLSRMVTLKASFVRQHLQAMLSAPILTELSETTSMSDSRLPFVQLYWALFAASTYVSCQPNFVEPLVPLYRGTLSTADQVVLEMFQTFESVRRVSIASVLRSWSSSGLTGTERAFDAFTSLDGGKVNNTCALFPLNRKIGAGRQDKLESNEKIYDPIFIMALLGATLIEKDLTGLEWVEIMRCGGLGIVVCALSARDKSIREYANWLLAKTFSIISGTPFHERDQLLYTLRLVRHAISSPEQSNSFPRIPPMISLFLSYVIRAQATPSHFLYPITSRFLLQRPVFDTTDVPALYSMLYASEEGWKNERAWIVRLLRDGMKSETDWRVTKRRHTWSLLATLFQSSLDIPFRRLILQALASFVRVPMAVRSLVTRDCILIWLETQFQQSLQFPNKAADEERASMLQIYETIVAELVRAEEQRGTTTRAIENGDQEDSAAGQSVRSSPGWILDVDIFVQRASFEADSDRLECLSRILKSISSVQLPVEAFLAVFDRLDSVKNENLAARVAENLFEAGLNLSGEAEDFGYRLDNLQTAVSVLKRKVASSSSEEGNWVRRATRTQVFEESAQK